jgi:hypothetical protein
MGSERIEVWLGYGSSEEQGHVVQDLFETVGIRVEVRLESAYPPEGNGAGFAILAALIGMTLGNFVTGYFQAAGADAWRKSKDLMRGLKEDHLRRYPSEPPTAEGQISFKDVKHRRHLNIRTDLPDEAYAKLSEVDFDAREDVAYSWDPEKEEWVVYDLSGIEDRTARTKDDPDIADD